MTVKAQATFAFGDCQCGRCGRPCKVAPVPGSEARMLKRGSEPKGLCVNCAVHDQLRHLYPANLILARSGPKGLALPHIQRQFYEICRMSHLVDGRPVGTDARFEEIDWQAIIANWDLPFPTPLKSTATNPVTQADLDRERAEGGTFQLTVQEQWAKHKAELDAAARKLLDGAA